LAHPLSKQNSLSKIPKIFSSQPEIFHLYYLVELRRDPKSGSAQAADVAAMPPAD
jgi:hypothetical protein